MLETNSRTAIAMPCCMAFCCHRRIQRPAHVPLVTAAFPADACRAPSRVEVFLSVSFSYFLHPGLAREAVSFACSPRARSCSFSCKAFTSRFHGRRRARPSVTRRTTTSKFLAMIHALYLSSLRSSYRAGAHGETRGFFCSIPGVSMEGVDCLSFHGRVPPGRTCFFVFDPSTPHAPSP